jgi:hypothetical protein
MYVDRLAVLPIRALGALQSTFACIGCAASASADIFASAKSHVQRVTASPPPPTRTEGTADVIVISRKRKHER